jgi:hypothetical protein
VEGAFVSASERVLSGLSLREVSDISVVLSSVQGLKFRDTGVQSSSGGYAKLITLWLTRADNCNCYLR